ncbi:uncharacterized protein LOC116287179, partial [Actinia tenebrosa]|uniref:Uncharacterized protein LOC116287179 n=1 Tax=Actinia tenebrosa TaxID=6105 RepID=A0A6P8HB12_ACTTE
VTIRGHCIFWAVPNEVPSWLVNLPKRQLYGRMQQRMEDLLGRYSRRFVHWDVNNEMLHGSFFADRFDKSIREWMFKRAAELDADADLFINDFDVVENSQMTELLVEQAKELIDRGVDVDGIGVQGHFTGSINPVLLRLRLNTLAEVGRPIWLTEVDILNKDPVGRANSLEALMRTAFSHPSVHGIMFWAFWDRNSWRGPDVALVNGDEWKLNAAGERYIKLLNQWTTREILSPTTVDKHGAEVRFSGFYGDYDVTVTLPGGNVIKKQFTLEPGYDEFNLKIDIGNQPYFHTSPPPVPQETQDFTKQLNNITTQLNNLLLEQGPDQRLPDEGVREEETG